MLGKILLTIAVFVAAMIFVRQRNLARPGKQRGNGESASQSVKPAKVRDEFSNDLRMAAYLSLVLMVGLGATLYYLRWQDDHEIVTVTLHRESQAEPISYQVYKYQLQDRSFITVDGTSVTVAGSERMEILGLD